MLRLMKGRFLFQHEKSAPREINYAFKPYDYGPFTPEIYRDVEALAELGYVSEAPSGKAYRITEPGKRYLSTLTFDKKAEEELVELRVEVEDLSFRDLLRRVYSAHPESAKRSLAKDILG